MRVSGSTARTTSGPKEMFGTKWPSMISRCSQSALARRARTVSFASWPKLAASSDGAIVIRAKLMQARRARQSARDLLRGDPVQTVAQKLLIGRMFVRFAVVPEGDSHDARLWVLDHKDHRIGLILLKGMRGREHLNGSTLRIRLKPVKFVANHESCRHAYHQRVCRVSDFHFELAVFIVTPGAASGEDTIVFRPVGPVIPEAWMDQEQSFSRISEVEDALPSGNVFYRLII